MTQENLAENENTEIDNADSESIQGEPEEFEITLDTPENEGRKKSPMVRRILGQREKLRDENSELREQLAELQRQVSQNAPGSKSTAELKWEDFNSDAEYQEAVRNKLLQEQVLNQPKVDPVKHYQQTQRLEQGIEKHYKRAEELAGKFPEYSKAEQVATEILGDELAREIALRASNSAELMLYLGSNPGEAEQFRNLTLKDPIQGGIELGRLDAKVSIKSKGKTKLPDPDEPLQGGSSGISVQTLQKKRDKALESGNLAEARRLKSEAKAKGIKLE